MKLFHIVAIDNCQHFLSCSGFKVVTVNDIAVAKPL